MAGDVRLVAPRVRVYRDGDDEPLEVQCDNRDLLLWESTRGRHKWPKFEDAPFKWLTFLSWSALRRTGELNGTTYEAYEATVLSVTDTRADEEAGLPTDPGPDPG